MSHAVGVPLVGTLKKISKPLLGHPQGEPLHCAILFNHFGK